MCEDCDITKHRLEYLLRTETIPQKLSMQLLDIIIQMNPKVKEAWKKIYNNIVV